MTSTLASKALSSRLGASMGPLTADVTVYPWYVYVAEPSAFGRFANWATGSALKAMIYVAK